MHQGRIVEYIEGGNVVSTLCLHDDGSRLHLLTPTNREVNLPPKRALLISGGFLNTASPRDELLSKLRKIEARRIELQEEVKVVDLWELIRDEKEVLDARDLAELCFGEKVSDDQVSALIRALFKDKLYFKLKDGRFLPNPGHRVEQILKEREEVAGRERRLQEGGRWLRQVLEGRAAGEPSCKEEIVDVLKSLALYREEAPEFRFGKDLLARAGIADVGEARNILLRLGIWEEDENLDLLRLKVKIEFDREEEEESARLARVSPSLTGREDLRDLQIFTIDGPLTRDYDDAISLDVRDGLIHLGIHISDAASLIPVGSTLDRTLAERGTSLYLTRHQIPMMPRLLSQDALSLKQDADRPALSLLCTLDREGNLLDSRFTLSLIRVKNQLTYDWVNDVCGVDECMAELCRLSQLMRQKRIEQGAMHLSLPEVYVKVDDEGRVSIRLLPQETPSRMAVAELMIMYNWLAARYCKEHGVPILYRCQQPPNELVAPDIAGSLYGVLKQRGKLSPLEIRKEPKPHTGLGLDVYTNVSSPIRRFFDLVIQRQIRNSLLGTPPPYSSEELERVRTILEPMLRDLERLKRNRLRYWTLKYLHQHVGETFPAVVMGLLKSKCRIVLSDFLFITEMKRQEGANLHEGESILVKLRRADPWNDALRLDYAGSA